MSGLGDACRWSSAAEDGELAGLLGEQVVDRDPVLAVGALQLGTDGGEELVLLRGVGDLELLGEEALLHPVELGLVGEGDERGIGLLESDPAVAAASIFAREKFVGWLAAASSEWGVELLKGVSPAVKENAGKLVAKHGSGVLKQVAKLHFRTTQEIVSS